MHAKKTAFVVEHDFIMATYLADRVIVYDGRPGVETYARTPQVPIHTHVMFYTFTCMISFCIYALLYICTSYISIFYTGTRHIYYTPYTLTLTLCIPPYTLYIQGLIPVMNTFLKLLNITFRRDPTHYRPRINKIESVKDKEQKLAGNYFYVEDD